MTKEVREARLAGLLPGINFAEFSVLLIMADTCRGESRQASISMAELEKLSGQERTSMWRAVNKLIRRGYIRRLFRGNQFEASKYDVLPGARCATATSTETDARCAGATSTETEHVASETEHVALAQEHVALASSARCAGATYPTVPNVTIPLENPAPRARESDALTLYAAEIVNKRVYPRNRHGQAKPAVIVAVADALRRGLAEDRLLAVIDDWQRYGGRRYVDQLRMLLSRALAEEGL